MKNFKKTIINFLKKVNLYSLLKFMYKRILNFKRVGYIENDNIYFLYNQSLVYKKLYSRYKSIIDNKIKDKKEAKSDNIWLFWYQGIENAPDLIKACYNSVCLYAVGKNIVVLDKNNIFKYVNFPNYIVEKFNSKIISITHFSDLLRLYLLINYGGLWLDATVLLTSNDDLYNYITNSKLFVFKDLDLIRHNTMPTIASNWLINSWSNNRILRLTYDLLLNYWKDYDYLIDYYIFHYFFKMSCEKYFNEYNDIFMFNNRTPHTLQFELKNNFSEFRWQQIIKMCCFHKLNRYINNDSNNNDFYNYIIKRFNNGVK